MPTDRERVAQLFFFGLLALMAYELYELMQPFLTPIAWAILLAFVVHPVQLEVTRLVKSRSLAAVIISIGVGVLLVAPSLWISGKLGTEANALYNEVADFVAHGGVGRAHDWMMRNEQAAALGRRLAEHGYRLDDELPKLAMQAAQITSDYVVRNLTNVARNAVRFVLDLGIALLVFFYLLRDGEFYYDTLRALTPLHAEDTAAVFDSLRSTLSAVMRGLMLTAVLQGVSIGLAMLVAGVPYWAFLTILTMACGLLPFGGTALVWIPAAGYLIRASGWPAALALVVWCSIAVGVIDNVIKPLAMRHGTGLPTLVLFFGVAGGLAAYGPLGLFAGPAIISVLVALLRVFRRTYSPGG